MKILFKSVLLFIFFQHQASTMASEYYCPKITSKIKINDVLENTWVIWPLDDEINLSNQIYYKVMQKEYEILKWNSYPQGVYIKKGERKKRFIACCRLIKENNIRICAYKTVKEKHCKPFLKRQPTVKFICTDKI